MDLAQARDAVYLRTGYDSSDGQLTPQIVTECLRSALNFLATERDWDWLQTSESLSTVSGTPYVTPLAGSASGVTWVRTLNLVVSDASQIVQAPWPSYRAFPPDATGQPYKYAEQQGRLYLWPVPDGVYTLYHDFIRGEPALTSDTSVPLLPAYFHDAWVEKAATIAYRRVGEPARAGEADAIYKDWLRVMVDNRKRSAGPYKIRVRPGSWI